MKEEPLYYEYHKIYHKFKEASRRYDRILEDKAMLYFNTQPKSTDLTKEIVSGGSVPNKFIEFVERLEKIDIELQTARNERDLQQYLLKKKELELRESKEVMDKLYLLSYVEHMKVRNIAIRLNYSKEQSYRKLREIGEKIQDDTK